MTMTLKNKVLPNIKCRVI